VDVGKAEVSNPPEVILWIVCIWWLCHAGWWTINTVIKIRDAMEAEERRRRQSSGN
jgi:hypothetical protein